MIEESNKVLNYRGLEHFLEKLKLYFIVKPKTGNVWQVLTLLPEGKIEWSNIPKMLRYKGAVSTYSALENIENPQEGWVYYVSENQAEYYWNGELWEYFGQEFEVPEYTAGDAIDINNNEISVLFDGSSILVDDEDGLYVAPNLYINGNDNISIEEKEENERAISVLGYKWDPDNKSFAEGKFSNSSSTPAQGSYSHTEGRDTRTEGLAAHAEGYFTLAEGKASHAEGYGILFNTSASGFDWFETTDHGADLKITIETSSGASSKTILTLLREIYFISEISDLSIYLYSRDEKESCAVYKYYLEINGSEFDPEDPYTGITITSGAIYFKVNDTSLIGGALDFLVYNYARSQASHVEGKNTETGGKNSHAEGLVNKANGENSHVEGHLNYINSDGYNAHAEGYNTRALKNQAHSEGANTLAYGENSHVEGEETCAFGKDSHAEGKSTKCPALFDETYFNGSLSSVYEAWKTNHTSSTGNYSCAWGNASHLEGKDNLALGNNSHAEGLATCAYGDKSHAEGYGTLAKENNSHAEGDGSKATELASHAEGFYTTASGLYSHAEGGSFSESLNNQLYMTVASGRCSHSEGYITHAQNESEHAEGHCNKSHKTSDTYGNAGNTQHSIGIGTISYYYGGINFYPKNALEIMQNGDIYVYGVGGYQGTDTKIQDSSINTLQDSLGDINIIETVKVNGTALIPDANKAVDVTVPENTLHELTITDDLYYSINVSYSNATHNLIYLTDTGEGNTFTINVNTSITSSAPKEIIYHINAVNSVSLVIQLLQGDSGVLERYTSLTSIRDSVEIVFTFWKNGLVTYNGRENQ